MSRLIKKIYKPLVKSSYEFSIANLQMNLELEILEPPIKVKKPRVTRTKKNTNEIIDKPKRQRKKTYAENEIQLADYAENEIQLAEPILTATIIDNLEPEIQDEDEPAKTFDEEVVIERKKMIKLHTSSLALNELNAIKEIITRLEKDIKNIKSRLKMLI
jgi:hypothetical protein